MKLPQRERTTDAILTPRQKDAADYALDPSEFNEFMTRRAVEILIGKDKEEIPFPPGYTTTTIITRLEVGDTLRNVAVRVYEAYPGGVKMSLGFSANPEEIIELNDVQLAKLGVYIFYPYRISEVDENLILYFTGGPAGAGRITLFLEG